MTQTKTKETKQKPVKEKVTVVDIVVDRVLQMIEENKQLPWDRPWQTGLMNWYSEREYRGINVFLLGGSGEYLTLNQLNMYNKKNGTNYRIKEDQLKKYYIVVLYKPYKKRCTQKEIEEYRAKGQIGKLGLDDDGFFTLKFMLRYYRVYDIAQTTNDEGQSLESKFAKHGEESEDKYQRFHYEADTLATTYLKRESIKLVSMNSGEAYYTPVFDAINMPKKETFKTRSSYYKVLFHEMTHSTGTKERLNRKWMLEYQNSMSTRGVEELIAEIGACYLLTECGFTEEEMDVNNTEAYLLGWSKWIKDNKQSFMTACTQATKAVDFIIHGKDVPQQEEGSEEDSE